MSFSIVMHRCQHLQAFFRAVAIFTAAVTASGSARCAEPAAEHVGRGYQLVQDQRYAEAAAEFRAALAINSRLTRARYQLAICLFGLGDRDGAEKEFKEVRREASDKRGAVYYLGRLRLLAGDNEGAVRLLQPLAMNPPLPDTLFYLGCAWLENGDTSKAIDALKKTALAAPRDYRIPYRLARAYARARKPDEARREYERSSVLRQQYNAAARASTECAAELDAGAPDTACQRMFDPVDPDKLTTLGIIYGQHGAFERAIPPLIAASKLDPDSFEIFHNLGLSYFRLRRFEAARPALERAVSLRPDFFGSNALLGAVLFTLRDDQAAYAVLSHAYELDPSNRDVSNLLFKISVGLARERFEAHDYTGAASCLRKATDLRPEDAGLHRKLAEIYRLVGSTEESLREEKRAEELERAR